LKKDFITKLRPSRKPGFDGEYGKPLFSDKERVEISVDKPKFQQKGLDEF